MKTKSKLFWYSKKTKENALWINANNAIGQEIATGTLAVFTKWSGQIGAAIFGYLGENTIQVVVLTAGWWAAII